ncbi:hypothetical protein LguiA_008512 [Lonicera macranthoides]
MDWSKKWQLVSRARSLPRKKAIFSFSLFSSLSSFALFISLSSFFSLHKLEIESSKIFFLPSS